MENKVENWIAFYYRHGEQVSFPFYSADRPTLENVTSKIRMRHDLVDYVLPYTPEGTTPDIKAQAFLKINNIDGLVFTPFVNKESSEK